jgi:hypothetical protein
MQVRRVLSLSIQAVHLLASCFPHALRMDLSAPRSCPTKEGPSRTERSSVIPCMACCSHSASSSYARSAVSLLKPSGCQAPEESGWGPAFSEHRMVLLLGPFPLLSTLTLKSVTPTYVVWNRMIYIDVILTPLINNAGPWNISSLGGRLSCHSRGYPH